MSIILQNYFFVCENSKISYIPDSSSFRISINEIEGEKTVTYEVKVAESDMGKVIGKQGRIAKAFRTVVNAAATRENKKVTVEIVKE